METMKQGVVLLGESDNILFMNSAVTTLIKMAIA